MVAIILSPRRAHRFLTGVGRHASREIPVDAKTPGAVARCSLPSAAEDASPRRHRVARDHPADPEVPRPLCRSTQLSRAAPGSAVSAVMRPLSFAAAGCDPFPTSYRVLHVLLLLLFCAALFAASLANIRHRWVL